MNAYVFALYRSIVCMHADAFTTMYTTAAWIFLIKLLNSDFVSCVITLLSLDSVLLVCFNHRMLS